MLAKTLFSVIAALFATALLGPSLGLSAAGSAAAAPPSSRTPSAASSLSNGLKAMVDAAATVQKFKVSDERAVLTLKDGKKSRKVTFDYGELLGGDKRVATLIYLAIGYLALGLIARAMRVVYLTANVFGRPGG